MILLLGGVKGFPHPMDGSGKDVHEKLKEANNVNLELHNSTLSIVDIPSISVTVRLASHCCLIAPSKAKRISVTPWHRRSKQNPRIKYIGFGSREILVRAEDFVGLCYPHRGELQAKIVLPAVSVNRAC